MNKYVVILLLGITCLLTACGYREFLQSYLGTPSGSAVSGGGMKNDADRTLPTGQWGLKTASGSSLYEIRGETVSGAVVSGSGVASADNVTAQMQTADYWIDRTMTPDKVLMSAEEITAFNGKMLKQLAANPAAGYYDLSSFGDTVSGEMLTSMIQRPDFSKGSYWGLRPEEEDSRLTRQQTSISADEPVSDKTWKEMEENKNLSAVRETNNISYGIVCLPAPVRELPSARYITDQKGDTGHDVLQDTLLAVNEPVLMLHVSRDGGWFYVVANEYAGWVERYAVGLCADKAAWQKAQEMKRFLVVTGDRLPFAGLSYRRPLPDGGDAFWPMDVSGYPFFTADVSGYRCCTEQYSMGTRFEIVSKEEWEKESSSGARPPYDNYVVKMPYRDKEGQLQYTMAAIPLGLDVREGYMEYTRANVLRQAFKMLGNRYGWGGARGDRDCSSMTRDIYLCFGLRLPRNSSAQALIPGEARRDLSGKSEAEKNTALFSVEPGTILHMPGHVMLYLGCVNRQHFVISANGEFVPASVSEEIPAGDYTTRRVTVNTLGVRSPSKKETWLSLLETVVSIP